MIAVIVPIYNTEKYLQLAIESICQQIFTGNNRQCHLPDTVFCRAYPADFVR